MIQTYHAELAILFDLAGKQSRGSDVSLHGRSIPGEKYPLVGANGLVAERDLALDTTITLLFMDGLAW